jgi:two-component system, NtrC family, sensor kinase
MLNNDIEKKAGFLQYKYDLEKKQAQITVLNQEKRIQKNFLISTLIVLLLIIVSVFMLIGNIRHKQKANKLLEQQKQLIEEQSDQTNKAMAELQQTQKQLIQSEKMASLGELTAGIAHEIQNPLNFVNNFSEVNKELIEELSAERLKPNAERNEKLENEILNDIKANEEKINHHGKRADAIVKGMLQHSRSSSGQKEPTDINTLCDEYLRLSYHGLRAKDKSFSAIMKTDYDENIGNINIIPQDIGRVILNIINNAFYTVDEKKKAERIMQNAESYEPTVSVSTKKISGKVEIKVVDNGNGIPQKVLDKIFQPFFTTKPTGQGTGLGLSLSYDIVKAHGGEIKVITSEGIGSEFIISLSAN